MKDNFSLRKKKENNIELIFYLRGNVEGKIIAQKQKENIFTLINERIELKKIISLFLDAIAFIRILLWCLNEEKSIIYLFFTY